MSQIISATELHEIIGQSHLVLLDCRSDLNNSETAHTLYNSGHLPGALLAHLEEDLSSEIVPGATGRHPMPSAESFQQSMQKWGIQQDSTIVIYDQNTSMFAVRAWWLLKWAGLENVRVLNGGLQEWQRLGFEMQTDISLPEPSNVAITPKDDWVVAAEDLLNLGASDTLIDARALPRYKGEVEPLDTKAGHIPGAINADFTKNLDDSGLFLSKEALKARFSSLAGNSLISYCGSGVTGCHNILALVEAGYPMPRLYPGSWSEWIIDDLRPIGTGIEGAVL
jgi:thiosulfate/3-mercaptopyruvate sulfurtransferase